MIDVFQKPSPKNKKLNPMPAFNFSGMTTLLGFGFFAFLFLILGIFSFTRPLSRPAENIPYQQEGYFYYSATGTPGVYDTEIVRSGEPVFPRLTCYLNIGFTYNLLGDRLQGITGKQTMYARILDEPSGWHRTIPLTAETVFSGNTYFTTTTLDLCQVESIVNLVEKEAGLKQIAYTLEIVADASFNANVDEVLVSDSFVPKMVFKYDKIHFYLDEEDSQADPLHVTKSSMAGSSESVQNTVSILGFAIPVWLMRFISLLGFGVFLVSTGYVGMNMYQTTSQNQQALIRLKYGGMLIDVYEQNLAPTSSMIDVQSIEDLARLAERQGTMILHMSRNFLHYYFVQSNGTTYRYVISAGRQGNIDEIQEPVKEIAKQVAPIQMEMPASVPTKPVEEPKMQTPRIVYVYQPQPEINQPVLAQTRTVDTKPLIQESADEYNYVIDNGKIEFDFAQETVLPKIRL